MKHFALEYVTSFSKLLEKNQGYKNVVVGAASIHDITKALEIKRELTSYEVRRKFPPELRDCTTVFLEDNKMEHESLPPYQRKLDIQIKLQKEENGHDKGVI